MFKKIAVDVEEFPYSYFSLFIWDSVQCYGCLLIILISFVLFLRSSEEVDIKAISTVTLIA